MRGTTSEWWQGLGRNRFRDQQLRQPQQRWVQAPAAFQYDAQAVAPGLPFPCVRARVCIVAALLSNLVSPAPSPLLSLHCAATFSTRVRTRHGGAQPGGDGPIRPDRPGRIHSPEGRAAAGITPSSCLTWKAG